MADHDASCHTCEALSGSRVLTQGPRLDLGDHWMLEHCSPVDVEGWVVLVCRRHVLGLHNLTSEEATALGSWLPKVCNALHEVTGCESEYVIQFAEADGHRHVHFHLIARASEMPDERRGPRVMQALNAPNPIAAADEVRIMNGIRRALGLDATNEME